MSKSNINKFSIQKSFAISAGAGSGKTYTLSRRYINAVLGFDFFVEKSSQRNGIKNKEQNRATLSQIVTMTYTEAAALEMKERIFALMQKVVNFAKLPKKDGDYDSIAMGMKKLSDEDKSYVIQTLQEAIQNSNEAFISTIHSFCLDTIKEHSDIAKLDSEIAIIQADEQRKILDEIKTQVLSSDEVKTLSVFRRVDNFKAFQIIDKYATDAKFRESLDRFLTRPIAHQTYIDMIKELYPIPAMFDELEAEVASRNDSDNTFTYIEKYLQNFHNFEAMVWKEADDAKAPTLSKDTLLKEWAITTKKDLPSVYTQKLDPNLEREFLTQLNMLHQLLRTIHQAYLQRLKKENKLDFDAIIAKTAEIIKQVPTDYMYIMVDEFQDTNELQNTIVSQIAKGRNLFVVGDAKQSIYSFQGAELEVFHDAVNALERVAMNINYRSDKEILTFVNDIFRVLFEQDSTKKLIASNYKAQFTSEDELKANKRKKGSVEFLISQEVHKDTNDEQFKDIAKFIKAIKENKIAGYEEVKDAIKQKKKAIAIVFDASSKMLSLKRELNRLGIECKVSATENFYHTREINDIFFILKSIELLNRKRDKLQKAQEVNLYKNEKFYLAGALRSGAFRYDEKKIVALFRQDIQELIDVFAEYLELANILPTSALIKQIVEKSRLLEVYLYLGDIAQREANIQKLITLAIEYETNEANDLYSFLEELERNIYFNDEIKEDEAFYKSENVESVELCTIHSTKGLAYPMIILAQSEKGLHHNATGTMGLSFNTFTLNEKERYSAVGFKIREYEPLIYRILKQIGKNKHEAEKKRLLYVALTRAEHNLVIAGSLYKTAKDEIGLSDNSYLGWITNRVFGLDKEIVFEQTPNEKIRFIDTTKFANIQGEKISPHSLEVVDFAHQEVQFQTTTKKIASKDEEAKEIINENLAKQARIGTIIHSVLQRYWDKFEDKYMIESIFKKYMILDEDIKQKLLIYIQNFKTSSVYKKLKDGAQHYFEIELNMYDGKKQTQGVIDLLYYDAQKEGWVIVDFKSNHVDGVKNLQKFASEHGYDKQLQTYEELCKSKGMRVVDKLLLFLDSGDTLKIQTSTN